MLCLLQLSVYNWMVYIALFFSEQCNACDLIIVLTMANCYCQLIPVLCVPIYIVYHVTPVYSQWPSVYTRMGIYNYLFLHTYLWIFYKIRIHLTFKDLLLLACKWKQTRIIWRHCQINTVLMRRVTKYASTNNIFNTCVH